MGREAMQPEIIDYLIAVAKDKAGAERKRTHSDDLASCVKSLSICFASRSDYALRRHLPKSGTVPILNTEKICESIVTDPAGFGGIEDYARLFEITPGQMAGILRGNVDVDIDLWQILALANSLNLHVSVSARTKEERSNTTAGPRTEASAESPAPAPRAG